MRKQERGARPNGLKGCWKVSCYALLLLSFVACSTTGHLPRGEQLYTGIERIEIVDKKHLRDADAALHEAEESLAYAPNNAFFGSSSKRTPIPFGLWVYNANVGKSGKINQWLLKNVASRPILVSMVNPSLRADLAEQQLQENGFFNALVSHVTVPHKKDSLKAAIRYQITLNEPYRYDTIDYEQFHHHLDTLFRPENDQRILHPGELFSRVHLEEERQRLAVIMRNQGYFYFRPEYVIYQADSSQQSHKVRLKMELKKGIPPSILHPWVIGDVSFYMSGYDHELPTDTFRYKDITIYYESKMRLQPKALYHQLRFKPGERYALNQHVETQYRLNKLGLFRYADIQFMPKDSLPTCDTLNVRISTSYDYPFTSELEMKATANDNDYIGPGALFRWTQLNLFGGGETFSSSIYGLYEWEVSGRKESHTGVVNNFEYGLNTNLSFPRLLLPPIGRRKYDFLAKTELMLFVAQQNRARYFQKLNLGGEISYHFVPNPIRSHVLVPFRLTYSKLQRTTARFDSLVHLNPLLNQSLQNHFVPVIAYSYTLDNSSVRDVKSRTWWNFTVSEAGNLLSGVSAIAGKRFDEEKTIFGSPYAQFLKVTSEFRYNHYINRNRHLALRIGGGVIYSYGNMLTAPYSEQFYVGGANSIRAFTIRSVGPGRFRPDRENLYAYIDQIGDIKLEMNIEYRFHLIGNLEGALFLDGGNVWLMRPDEKRPGGSIAWRSFLNDIATGTGVGFRYHFNTLVLRFDLGCALHLPSEQNKGYFNASSWSDVFGFHLALGYPF